MSLLRDALTVLRGNVSVHLAHDPERGATYKCLHCPTRLLFGSGEAFVHAPQCPVLSMPQILKAVVAAERYVSLNRRDDVPMTDLMRAEDDLHEAFGDARRYDDPVAPDS